eukprot:gene172-189_t
MRRRSSSSSSARASAKRRRRAGGADARAGQTQSARLPETPGSSPRRSGVSACPRAPLPDGCESRSASGRRADRRSCSSRGNVRGSAAGLFSAGEKSRATHIAGSLSAGDHIGQTDEKRQAALIAEKRAALVAQLVRADPTRVARGALEADPTVEANPTGLDAGPTGLHGDDPTVQDWLRGGSGPAAGSVGRSVGSTGGASKAALPRKQAVGGEVAVEAAGFQGAALERSVQGEIAEIAGVEIEVEVEGEAVAIEIKGGATSPSSCGEGRQETRETGVLERRCQACRFASFARRECQALEQRFTKGTDLTSSSESGSSETSSITPRGKALKTAPRTHEDRRSLQVRGAKTAVTRGTTVTGSSSKPVAGPSSKPAGGHPKTAARGSLGEGAKMVGGASKSGDGKAAAFEAGNSKRGTLNPGLGATSSTSSAPVCAKTAGVGSSGAKTGGAERGAGVAGPSRPPAAPAPQVGVAEGAATAVDRRAAGSASRGGAESAQGVAAESGRQQRGRLTRSVEIQACADFAPAETQTCPVATSRSAGTQTCAATLVSAGTQTSQTSQTSETSEPAVLASTGSQTCAWLLQPATRLKPAACNQTEVKFSGTALSQCISVGVDVALCSRAAAPGGSVGAEACVGQSVQSVQSAVQVPCRQGKQLGHGSGALSEASKRKLLALRQRRLGAAAAASSAEQAVERLPARCTARAEGEEKPAQRQSEQGHPDAESGLGLGIVSDADHRVRVAREKLREICEKTRSAADALSRAALPAVCLAGDVRRLANCESLPPKPECSEWRRIVEDLLAGVERAASVLGSHDKYPVPSRTGTRLDHLRNSLDHLGNSLDHRGRVSDVPSADGGVAAVGTTGAAILPGATRGAPDSSAGAAEDSVQPVGARIRREDSVQPVLKASREDSVQPEKAPPPPADSASVDTSSRGPEDIEDIEDIDRGGPPGTLSKCSGSPPKARSESESAPRKSRKSSECAEDGCAEKVVEFREMGG